MKFENSKKIVKKLHRTNYEIRVENVRLLNDEGQQLGIKTIREALHLADLKQLDLVEIVPSAIPPVCKICDYGKLIYEHKKREKEKKKNEFKQEIKEIRFKWRTDVHDLNFKIKHAIGFLEEGNKVKASVTFKGREITMPEIGRKLLEKFIDALKEKSEIDQELKLIGKSMQVVLKPIKIKK